MTESASFSPRRPSRPDLADLLKGCAGRLEELFAASGCSHWGLSRERFSRAVERGAQHLFASGSGELTALRLEHYLRTLHPADLALATACADRNEAAWEHFVSVYRPYLRSAASAILKTQSGSAEAFELADSLFAELFGVAGGRAERSLFAYFHGRSSLKTWLRAVLSRRHIDALRAKGRFQELAEADGADSPPREGAPAASATLDPHRGRYLALFTRALSESLAETEASDRERLRLYYAEEQTLAEIGRILGEHESSVSRHLESTRKALRHRVEQRLRAGFGAVDGAGPQAGLDSAEIALCFEYAAEEVPIDLGRLLPAGPPAEDAQRRKGPGEAPARKA